MLETGANIATMFLIVEGLIILVVLTALAVALAMLMVQLNRKVKGVMPTVQGYARQLADKTEGVSQKAAGPFIRFEASQARWQAMRQHVLSSLGSLGQAGKQQSSVKEE